MIKEITACYILGIITGICIGLIILDIIKFIIG